jgi:hypothetical protein
MRQTSTTVTLQGELYTVVLSEWYEPEGGNYCRHVKLFADRPGAPFDGVKAIIHGLTVQDVARNLEALSAEVREGSTDDCRIDRR